MQSAIGEFGHECFFMAYVIQCTLRELFAPAHLPYVAVRILTVLQSSIWGVPPLEAAIPLGLDERPVATNSEM